MRFKKYYKDIISLIASLSLLAMVYFMNHYDIKQMYREFATLSLKVDSQEKQIEKLMSEVEEYKKLYTNCLLYTSPSPRDRQKSRMPSSA